MRKLLLILGAARYPRRSELALPAFPLAREAFKRAMTEGTTPIVAPEDCLDLFDVDAAWVEQQNQIATWLDEKRQESATPDVLLLYYVGHGGIEKGEQVYLTLNSTNNIDPYHSSLPRDSLARLLRASANEYRKFLILDCCFAASILKALQSPFQDKMHLELREVAKVMSKPDWGGLAALCASSSLAAANANGRDGLTQFTDGLLSALRVGDPSSPSDLSFETLRTLIERQLSERYGPDAVPPSSYFADDFFKPIHQLPIFPNRAERPFHVFSPRTVRPDPRSRSEDDPSLQLAAGNPSTAARSPDDFLLMRPQFAASFNCSKGRPNWVSWHLTYADFGKAPRSGRWRADTMLPTEANELSPHLLAGSGYDRGHLCPPHNRAGSVADNEAVFQMSNVVAQSRIRNQKLWQGFEEFCRHLVEQRQCDLFISAGPLGSLKTIANGRIEVPAALWKIVLCVPAGHIPGARTKYAEVIAIRMSNHERAAIEDWTEALVTVSSLEDETGYSFFGTLPRHLSAQLKRVQITKPASEMVLALTGGAITTAGSRWPDPEAQERRERAQLRATLSATTLDRLEVRWVFANPPEEIQTIVEIGRAMSDTRLLRDDELSRLPIDILATITAGFALDDTLLPLLNVIAEGKSDLASLYDGDSVASVLETFGSHEWVENVGSPIGYAGPTRDLLFPLNMKGTAIVALGKASDDQEETETEFIMAGGFPRRV